MATAEKGPQNGILYFFMLLGLFIAGTNLRGYLANHDNSSLVFTVSAVCFIGALGFARTRSPSFKQKLTALLFSTLVSGYLLETVLAFLPNLSGDLFDVGAAAAKRQGHAFDTRTKFQALMDLRAKDAAWYPAVNPLHFMPDRGVKIGETLVQPLGGVGDAQTVDCNENGYYSTPKTDELGFVNPPGIWQDRSPFDVVILGDSFAKGCCVQPSEGTAARVREVFPHTVTLGSMGNGPLVELATFSEYFQERQAKFVFWFYYEGNDLADLNQREAALPTLQKYLKDPQFTQGIEAHQAEMNAGLKAYVEEFVRRTQADTHPVYDFLHDRATLASTRRCLFNVKSMLVKTPPTPFDLQPFSQVLHAAKERVEKRGGKLVFVYLPERGRYLDNRYVALSGAHLRKEVLALAATQGLDILDMDPVFARLKDPKSVFPFGIFGHYNAAGYQMIADEIVAYVRKHP